MMWLTYPLPTVGALAALSLVLIGISYLVYIPLLVRLITQTGITLSVPPCEAARAGRSVRFATRYRGRIDGTLWEPQRRGPARGTVILCHPYGKLRWHMAGLAKPLTTAGWNVLAFDFCGHGASPARNGYRSVGWVSQYELWDIEAALRFVRKREGGNHDIWLLGMSKGANAALCAAAIWDEIKVVVADGAFGTLPMIEHHYRHLVASSSRLAALWSRLPKFWVYAYLHPALRVAAVRCRCRFLPIMALLPRIKQPVLLIRGERDRLVPEELTMQIQRTLSGPVELLSVPRARHNESFSTDPKTYVRNVLALVDQVLPAKLSPPRHASSPKSPSRMHEDLESANCSAEHGGCLEKTLELHEVGSARA